MVYLPSTYTNVFANADISRYSERSDKMEIDHVGQGAPPASPVQLTTSPRKKKRKKMLNPDSGAANLFSLLRPLDETVPLRIILWLP